MLEEMLEQKFLVLIDEIDQEKDQLRTWQHGLKETLELNLTI